MSEKLEQLEARFADLCDTVATLRKQMGEFRKLFEPECVDFDDIDEILFHMLGEIDGQLMEENL